MRLRHGNGIVLVGRHMLSVAMSISAELPPPPPWSTTTTFFVWHTSCGSTTYYSLLLYLLRVYSYCVHINKRWITISVVSKQRRTGNPLKSVMNSSVCQSTVTHPTRGIEDLAGDSGLCMSYVGFRLIKQVIEEYKVSIRHSNSSTPPHYSSNARIQTLL